MLLTSIIGISNTKVYATELDEIIVRAEKGNGTAQFDLGQKYRNGDGILQNYILAHMWYNIAGVNGVEAAKQERDKLTNLMTSSQVAEAQSKAGEWMKSSPAKNIVIPASVNTESFIGTLVKKPTLGTTPTLEVIPTLGTTPTLGVSSVEVASASVGLVEPQKKINTGDNRGFSDCDGCPQMIKVSAGKYSRGAKYGPNDQRPKHTVTIPYSFSVGAYEVTIANWELCLAEGGCEGYRPYETGADINLPVGSVNWKDAHNYTRWLSKKTGHVYRLLSESEWEYVARGGTETRFSWGDSLKEGNNTLNSSDNVGGRISSMGQSMAQGFLSAAIGSMNASKSGVTPVGSYVANPWGLYDVHGNNWEWVEDCYNENYYGVPNNGSARIKNCSKRGKRVLRGGLVMINMNLHLTDSRHRSSRGTNSREFNVGFRVARDG